MTEWGGLPLPSLPALLVFIRLSGFFLSSPFPGRLAPARARLMIAAGLAWGFAPTVPGAEPSVLWASVILEVLLGIVMGYLLTLVMHAFAYAGEAVSQQMGLRMPGFANPVDSNMSLLGGAFSMMMLGFFAMGPGPRRLCAFLYRMFELIPVGAEGTSFASVDALIQAGSELFAGALNVSAPVMAAVFAAQLVLAVLAKSVPTLNLFIEGPALTTGSGIIGLLATVNTFGPLVDRMVTRRLEQIAHWLTSIG